MTQSSHTYKQNSIKCISLNTKGLNIPEKRSQLLLYIRRLKGDIVLLQETHFRSDNIPKLTDRYYPTVYHATNPQAKTKGVTILISKNLPLNISDTHIDKDGRYLLIKGIIWNKPITIANIYAPNSAQVTFFREIATTLSAFQSGLLLMGGDFNVPLNPLLDTSTSTSSIPFKALRQIKIQLHDLLLHDTWRTLHPNMKDFTFFSPPHNRYSRIDYIFLSQKDLSCLDQATIEPSFLSDHHPITATITFPEQTPFSKSWRLDASILTDSSHLSTLTQNIKDYFSQNDTPDMDPIIQWEAHKCVLRGTLMQLSAQRKRAKQIKINTLLNKIKDLERAHKLTMAQTQLIELEYTRDQLREELGKKIRKNYTLSHKLFYQHSNKSGRLLARALQTKRANNTIRTIRSAAGQRFSKSEDIAEQFAQFYSNLYNLPQEQTPSGHTKPRRELIDDFLKLHGPKPLSTAQSKSLDIPLNATEFKTAISQMKPGKCPGPDGFSMAYYKTFVDPLVEPYLKAFNKLSSPNPKPNNLLEAYISVIPKPGKDHELTANYRPISLLNNDIKIFAKILANRITPLLHNLISTDQVGFIPGRESRDNTIKALNIHHLLTKNNTPGFFLSLDAEKAFDRLAWDYLQSVLQSLGLGERLQQFIMSLYKHPTARIRANGLLSNAFPIKNGTRQGCPLSPILFVLTLEPLLNFIRANPNIKGISTTNKQYKIAAFADDILLFLTEPHITLPNLLQDLKSFQHISNFKINFDKSHALNISLSPEQVKSCVLNFPFSWNKHSITYLGIQLPTNLENLYAANFKPLLNNIKADLDKWDRSNFSWFGRIAILKMNVLPRILYALQTIPIKLPNTFFLSLTKLFRTFIWNHKRPRIQFTQLTKPKNKGGIGLPNPQHYYWACHLQRVVEWHTHSGLKDWISLENSFMTHHISITPWLKHTHIPLSLLSHPTIGPTLECSVKIFKRFDLTSRPQLLTPVISNPDFPPGMSHHPLSSKQPLIGLRLHHILRGCGLKSLEELNEQWAEPQLNFLQFQQLKHYVASMNRVSTTSQTPTLTPFEKLCLSTSPQRHLISVIHNMLWQNIKPDEGKACSDWSRDLQTKLTNNEWERIYRHTLKGSINVSIQENNYKILSRWYRTPHILHKFNPTIPSSCWRCQHPQADILHIWWTCPIIQTFWEKVHDLTQKITSLPLEYTPAQLILHHCKSNSYLYYKSLAMMLINAAKMCIPKLWRKTRPPSIKEWYNRINKIAEMEELISISSDNPNRFANTWSCWTHFKSTVAYQKVYQT